MKQYKFQPLVTPGPPTAAGAAVRPGQTRRMAVRGQGHDTHDSRMFSALVTDAGESPPRRADDHVIMTIALACDDPGEYFDIGDHFARWLGGDVGHGIVTRLFV